LKSVPCLVTKKQNEELLQPFTEEEFKEALKQLPAGKAAGSDGIPIEALKVLWPQVGYHIQQQFEEVLVTKKIHPTINKGIQTLIPKGGYKSHIGNYRPISVLLATYKLMAKVMANRMQRNLPRWIKSSQIGFVKDRYILDNVFLAYEAMEWAQELQQDLVILMIDFEKAYNQVNWTFLKATMYTHSYMHF